jgi:hypothetical protein
LHKNSYNTNSSCNSRTTVATSVVCSGRHITGYIINITASTTPAQQQINHTPHHCYNIQQLHHLYNSVCITCHITVTKAATTLSQQQQQHLYHSSYIACHIIQQEHVSHLTRKLSDMWPKKRGVVAFEFVYLLRKAIDSHVIDFYETFYYII